MSILKFNNIYGKNPKTLNIKWSRGQGKYETSMHSISSYLAMFAPALPEFFIEKYTKKGDMVMDPFSGRGTTALTSREMDRRFVGSDLNPYAIVLSRAKVEQYSKESLLSRLEQIETIYKSWILKNMNIIYKAKYKELRIYYSSKTLKQLVFFRETIGCKWRNNNSIDNAITSFAMGLMHGPTKKDGSTIYFSLDMSNTISMAPNYVKNYALNHNLSRPKINIFEHIRNRIHKKYHKVVSNNFNGKIMEHNAVLENKQIKNKSINLVITSPPYLSIVNYTTSNWLKLWFIGFDRKTLGKDINLSDNLKMTEYLSFITSFLKSIHPKLISGAKVCLIVGDVHGTKMIEKIWEYIKHNVNYDYIETYWDTGYLQSKKVTNSMNKRKGQATKLEKVLVLEKR